MGKKINQRFVIKLIISALMVGLVSIMGASATCYECQDANTSSNIDSMSINAMNKPNDPINDVPTTLFNKRCFSSCMKETWPYLPKWVKSTCGAVCRSCMNGNLLACSGCYGCTLGYTVGCANECL